MDDKQLNKQTKSLQNLETLRHLQKPQPQQKYQLNIPNNQNNFVNQKSTQKLSSNQLEQIGSLNEIKEIPQFQNKSRGSIQINQKHRSIIDIQYQLENNINNNQNQNQNSQIQSGNGQNLKCMEQKIKTYDQNQLLQEISKQQEKFPNKLMENAEKLQKQMQIIEQKAQKINEAKFKMQNDNINNIINTNYLLIAGIPDKIKESELASIFGTFGEIRSVNIPKEMSSGKQRGFAFVEYEDIEDAEHAIMNYNNTEIEGKVIKVQKSKKNNKSAFGKAIWHEEEEERKKKAEQEKEEEENEQQMEEFRKKQEEAQKKKQNINKKPQKNTTENPVKNDAYNDHMHKNKFYMKHNHFD
ncbi:hypothetical protein PPERSA_09557 [Pseudocohnilembus persalinus]|uniref:RRM domain-containing protein n=1 Tax=Pseudocohnilembus persalinus TaxID=266149 RepID=A0A0V0QFJ6_PSEPJ|nr:hypothetical protein PPERSA_09557 [Pseudocohnilembus persalinus]|eukprot:KRX00951.1 hypothetical protein PPERSA_09557 [Pseudocohnilembus persalinus]